MYKSTVVGQSLVQLKYRQHDYNIFKMIMDNVNRCSWAMVKNTKKESDY
jgi:hypothetical protein